MMFMKEIDIEEALMKLLSSMADCGGDVDIHPLAQSGSDRRYYRMCVGSKTYVGTFVPDPAEGFCFVRLSRDFRKVGVCVPEVLAVSDDGRFYIQEDLGNRSLFSLLAHPDAPQYIKETLLRLVSMQKTPEDVWKGDCISRDFSRRQVMWDLNYFKYEFLKPCEVVFDEDRLEDDFDLLSERLSCVSGEFYGFMMRDCQSRNVMLTDRGPVFIDFQGGRKGPVLYDAVSFLWQSRAGFDSCFRMEMLDHYCDAFCGGNSVKKREMLAGLDDMVLFRTLQVLGAYGFRGLVQHKSHFLQSIPGALINLRSLLDKGAIDSYPELKKASQILTSEPYCSAESNNSATLTVEIFSFSYKKGYPTDLSGNGGGFMFDCRALHNPGRYPQYRYKTGRDKEVKDFLESRGEVRHFLENVWSLTDSAIERYISRGFTRLQIGFGCTGGQHRSVYSAEQTAAHVRDLFPEVNVHLIHREHPEA